MAQYIIKSRRMRIYLQQNGLDCRVMQDRDNAGKDIYIFNDSKILHDLMTTYTTELTKKV